MRSRNLASSAAARRDSVRARRIWMGSPGCGSPGRPGLSMAAAISSRHAKYSRRQSIAHRETEIPGAAASCWRRCFSGARRPGCDLASQALFKGPVGADCLGLLSLGLLREQRCLRLLGRYRGKHPRERSGGPVGPVVLETVRFGRRRYGGSGTKLLTGVVPPPCCPNSLAAGDLGIRPSIGTRPRVPP